MGREALACQAPSYGTNTGIRHCCIAPYYYYDRFRLIVEPEKPNLYCLALSKGQNLKTERSFLPDDFQQLWEKVIGETGAAPVSYIKVKDANVISMSLPETEVRRATNILTTVEHKLKFNSNYVPDRASLHDSPVSSSRDVAVNTVPKRISSGATRISKYFVYLKGKQFPIVFYQANKTHCETLTLLNL